MKKILIAVIILICANSDLFGCPNYEGCIGDCIPDTVCYNNCHPGDGGYGYEVGIANPER